MPQRQACQRACGWTHATYEFASERMTGVMQYQEAVRRRDPIRRNERIGLTPHDLCISKFIEQRRIEKPRRFGDRDLVSCVKQCEQRPQRRSGGEAPSPYLTIALPSDES